jgi:hypothetical protein
MMTEEKDSPGTADNKTNSPTYTVKRNPFGSPFENIEDFAMSLVESDKMTIIEEEKAFVLKTYPHSRYSNKTPVVHLEIHIS